MGGVEEIKGGGGAVEAGEEVRNSNIDVNVSQTSNPIELPYLLGVLAKKFLMMHPGKHRAKTQ